MAFLTSTPPPLDTRCHCAYEEYKPLSSAALRCLAHNQTALCEFYRGWQDELDQDDPQRFEIFQKYMRASEKRAAINGVLLGRANPFPQ